MRVKLRKDTSEHPRGGDLAAVDVMGAVHEHFRFDDRHKIDFLAQGRIARQRMGVGANGVVGGNVVRVDFHHGAPFGESCPELLILCEPVAQSVQAFGHFVARLQCQRLRAFIHLDAGQDAPVPEQFGEGRAIAGGLAQRFLIEYDAADITFDAFGGEKYFAVPAPRFLGRFHPDRLEALLDGRTAFVCR